MDSRFFVSKPFQKDSFFAIRKVGIRETGDRRKAQTALRLPMSWTRSKLNQEDPKFLGEDQLS
ncbi:hypothetical protein, partial [Chryseosolibacter indicus]